MAWFIIRSERKTWTKYMVEAEEEEAALSFIDSWEYLGYVDGEDTESDIVSGPFKTKEEAGADTTSYVDG